MTYVCNLEHTDGVQFACSAEASMRDHLWLTHSMRMPVDELGQAPLPLRRKRSWFGRRDGNVA